MSRPRQTPELVADNARKAFQLEVKLQRVRFDMSQRELGEVLGISPPQISDLMANPDKLSVDRLRGIIRALSIDPLTVLHLLGYSDKDLRRYAQEPAEMPGVVPFRKCQ